MPLLPSKFKQAAMVITLKMLCNFYCTRFCKTSILSSFCDESVTEQTSQASLQNRQTDNGCREDRDSPQGDIAPQKHFYLSHGYLLQYCRLS
jgi:hypothetical protein